MGKKLTLICILAIALAISVPAYAEVQNIKVSGDMTVRSLFRQDFDLDNDTTAANANNNPERYFMQSVGLNLDADLTDNVSASIRLIDQRDWDNNSSVGTGDFDVAVDLAYVTLKEMIYAPLTLTIGRQDLWFGNGLIVGANVQDFNTTIGADEYTETSAFDAIRATLDFAPWTLDLVYSKIDSNATIANDGDDEVLVGANLGYKFDSYNAEAEGYIFSRIDGTTANATTQKVHTAGLRGSLEPLENLTLGAEGAFQFGDYGDIQLAVSEIDREAWAFDVYADYAMPNLTWSPTLGLEFLYLSGEDDTSSNNSEYEGWDAMYRGRFNTAIRDFQNYLYAAAARRAHTGNIIRAQDAQDGGLSNQLTLLVRGSVVPVEDVTLKGTYAHFWLQEKPQAGSLGSMADGDDVGDEIDLLLTYDYTEDVSFGLLAGWFIPGDMFPTGRDDTATDVVGSMKVVF